MKSLIALVLFISMIAYFFRTEHTFNPLRSSKALLLPLLWIILISCRSPSSWLAGGVFYDDAASYVEGNPIDRIVFFGTIGAGLWILLRRRVYWSQIFSENAPIFLLLGFAGISILWTDFPSVSLKRWVKALGNLIMVLIVITEAQPAQSMRRIISRCAYILIPLSVMLMRYFPALGRIANRSNYDSVYIGVADGKNPMGALALVCGIAVLWDIVVGFEKRLYTTQRLQFLSRAFLFLMVLWVFSITHSQTPFACLIVAIGIAIILSIPLVKRNSQYIGKYVIIFLVLIGSLQLSCDIRKIIVTELGRDVTLTGRVFLWHDVLQEKINPLIGAGYDGFWIGERLAHLWEIHWWRPHQAHNGYLETYVNLGLIGICLLALIIISSFRKSCYEVVHDFNHGRFRLIFFIIALFFNITEAAFQDLHIVWFTFLLMSVVTAPRLNNRELLPNNSYKGSE